MDSYNPVIYISGAISLYVYRYSYNNKLYFFFGDQHASMSRNCEEQYGMRCDVFDYGYEKSVLYDTNCWTIGSLLDEWFTYNNYNGIKTDFYFEISFIKGNLRRGLMIGREIRERRQEENYRDKLPKLIEKSDWIESISQFFGKCFVQEKGYCKYGPNVRFHYADIRKYTLLQDYRPIMEREDLYVGLSYTDMIISKLNILKKLKDDSYRIWLDSVLDNLVGIVKLYKILLNSDMILNLYFSTIDIRTILYSILIPNIDPDIQEVFERVRDTMTRNAVIRDSVLLNRAAAAEFNRLLKLDPFIANNLFLYMKDKIQADVLRVLSKLVDVEHEIFLFEESVKYATDNKPEILDGIGNLAYKCIDIVLDISIYSIDVYTLSRMFLQQDSEQIVTYSGGHHTENYAKFLKYLGAEAIIEHSSIRDNRCILSSLGALLNVNDFRNIYRKVP